jgi:UDP-N-acetyl-D-galactosamine dehydrogenase
MTTEAETGQEAERLTFIVTGTRPASSIRVAEAKHAYGLDCLPEAPAPGTYDAVILAVAHRDFVETGATGIRRWAKPTAILYDVKSVLPVETVDGRL